LGLKGTKRERDGERRRAQRVFIHREKVVIKEKEKKYKKDHLLQKKNNN